MSPKIGYQRSFEGVKSTYMMKIMDFPWSDPGRRTSTTAIVIIGFLAAICIALPAYYLLADVYAWHLKQPETVQGGIELLAVFMILGLTALVKGIPRFCAIAIILVSMLYLQLHSVLLTAAVAWVFLECLILMGNAVLKLMKIGGSNRGLQSYLIRVVTGIALWTLGALLLSAFRLGSISSLRVYSAVLAALSIAIAPAVPFSLALLRSFEPLGLRDKLLVLLLGALNLTQFGKVSYGNDYDSVWYGLRPERVLVGPLSLFDNLRLMHPVYYYPKQFEILTLPLSKLSHGAFIIPFNVALFAVCILAIYLIARSLNIDRSHALIVTILAGSIPAFSNMASTAKTDNLQSVYAFISVLFLWKWSTQRKPADFCYGLAAILGMVGTKISAYAYAPMLVLGFLCTGIWMHSIGRKNRPMEIHGAREIESTGWRYSPMVILGIAFCSCVGLMARSWLLTGIPTMPAFVDKWKLLGLSPKYPWSESGFVFAGVPIQSLQEFFLYWGRLLFDPRPYSHFVMAWPGNAGFFFACSLLIFAAFGSIRYGTQTAFLIACLPVMVGGIATACLVRVLDQGVTDGNYFAVPVILAILSVSGMLASAPGKARTTMTACSFGFILLQLPIMFVSHWSWHPGTQPFRFDLSRTLFSRTAEIEASLQKAGAWELEEYLRAHPGKGLCVGFAGGEESALRRLSCLNEDFEQTAPPFWRLFDSEMAFRGYLEWARPDIFYMPKSLSYTPCGPGRPVRTVFEELLKRKDVVRIESKSFIALDLSSLPRK